MSADDATDLPNLPMLIKLLKLTTSHNDAEALLAIRKANEQLKKFGGDWEALLRGKVTVIAEPAFANVNDDQIRRSGVASKPPPPSAPPPPKPTPQPQPQPRAWSAPPRSRPAASQPKPQPKASQPRAAKPQPRPSFANVDRVQLDDIV